MERVMNRADRKRQAKEDERLVANGLLLGSTDHIIALSRLLCSCAGKAKRTRSIDAFVEFLTGKLAATTHSLREEPIACRRGCSHCCYYWVTATPPEILSISKIVRRRGKAALARVMNAHEATKDYSIRARVEHPYPCPLLTDDGTCSIYPHRPKMCRFFNSADSAVCERSHHTMKTESIPNLETYNTANSAYAFAEAAALKAAQLSYRGCELASGLAHILEVEDAERAWLGGEDILAGAILDPDDFFDIPELRMFFEETFGS